MSTIMQETTSADGPTVDVLALTPQERRAELARFWHVEDGRYHLSGIKENAGIGSRDTHITLDQVKAMHRELGRIVDRLDKPASHGLWMANFIGHGHRSVDTLAANAGVDADALRRWLGGDGPLSEIAYGRVVNAMVTGKAAAA
jgi:hypothetical protein